MARAKVELRGALVSVLSLTVGTAACGLVLLAVGLPAPPLAILVASVACGLFCGWFGIGVYFSPRRKLVEVWMLSAILPMLVLIGFGFVVSLRPEVVLDWFPTVCWSLAGLVGTWVVVGSVIAGFGWYSLLLVDWTVPLPAPPTSPGTP